MSYKHHKMEVRVEGQAGPGCLQFTKQLQPFVRRDAWRENGLTQLGAGEMARLILTTQTP